MARVLIVEDDDRVRVLAEGILHDGGHQTVSASTTDQARALIESGEQLTSLFTDIGLQSDIKAGLTLAQEAINRKSNVRVLYTTGQSLTDGMKALFVERYGFLAKPYTSEQLAIAIQNLLELRRDRNVRLL